MHPAQAYLLLVSSAVGFGSMALLSKLACQTYDGATVAGVRFAIGAAVTGLLWASGRVDARPRHRNLLWLRGATGGIAVVLYFMSIERLSVGLATLLNYTSPAFTVFMARIFLGERVPRGGYVALGLTSLGVALVVFGKQDLGDAPPPDPVWVALALLSAVFSSGAIVSVRALRSRPEPETVWSIFLAFCLIGVVCAAPMSRGLHTPNPTELALLLGVGATAMGAQLGMNAVMRWVPAALFGITAQLAVVFTLVLGALLLDEPWSLTSATGAAITLAGVALAGYAHRPRDGAGSTPVGQFPQRQQ